MTANQLHILIIPSEAYTPPECPISGIFQRDQALILKEAGCRVGVLSLNLKSLRFVKKKEAWQRFGYHFDTCDGIPVYSFDSWNWSVRCHRLIRQRWLRAGRRLFREYIEREGRPDLIHSHNAVHAGMLARQIGTELDIPFVITEHSSGFAEGFYPSALNDEVQDVYRSAAGIIVVSPKLGELLDSIFKETAEKWDWIPNVLDSAFEETPLHIKDKKLSGIATILSIGNLDQNKDHAALLQAFADRFKGECQVRLRIAGEGPLQAHLNKLAQQLDVAGQVEFLGYIDRIKVLEEMDHCDFLVLPSRYETFGVVLIEALSRGRPVVATASGGPECIVDKSNGILVPPGDIDALADAMEAMVKKCVDYDPLKIRNQCLAKFGKAPILQKLLQIYREVLQTTPDEYEYIQRANLLDTDSTDEHR